MKKTGMIALSFLLTALLVLPMTLQAETERPCNECKGEKAKPHHFIHSLDLDEGTLEKMKEARLDLKEELLELRNKNAKKRLEMEKVLMKDELDFNKILDIHDEISSIRQKMARMILENKIEMYKLIPEDKKEGAKRIFLHGLLKKKHEFHERHGIPERHRHPIKR